MPPPPSTVSAPAPPIRTLAPLLPISTLSSSLPVALMAPVPVNVRFSMLPMACTGSARLKLTDDRTVSVPSPPVSFDHVAHIVDHIGVVASAAIHLVGAGAAVQRVGTSKTLRTFAPLLPMMTLSSVIARRVDRRRCQSASGSRYAMAAAIGKAEADRRPDRIGTHRHPVSFTTSPTLSTI